MKTAEIKKLNEQAENTYQAIMKINAKGSDIFRNKMAIMMYDNMRDNSDVYESGVDRYGMIYFAYLNGDIKRYKRNEFLKIAKENDKEE